MASSGLVAIGITVIIGTTATIIIIDTALNDRHSRFHGCRKLLRAISLLLLLWPHGSRRRTGQRKGAAGSAPPHHEGLRPHPEERALARVSKDETNEVEIRSPQFFSR
jgi:hypothetical protein